MKSILERLKRRGTPPSRTTPVFVRVRCADATVKTLTVNIPEATPACKIYSAAAVALYAQHEATGDRYRIDDISLRPIRAHGTFASLPVEAEGPILPLR